MNLQQNFTAYRIGNQILINANVFRMNHVTGSDIRMYLSLMTLSSAKVSQEAQVGLAKAVKLEN